jgi:hypothetical protein
MGFLVRERRINNSKPASLQGLPDELKVMIAGALMEAVYNDVACVDLFSGPDCFQLSWLAIRGLRALPDYQDIAQEYVNNMRIDAPDYGIGHTKGWVLCLLFTTMSDTYKSWKYE